MNSGKVLFFLGIYSRCMAALAVAALLAGCAPAALREIRKETTPGISIMQVASDPASFIGKKVLWGGIIASSKNLTKKTEINIVEVPLSRVMRPGNPDRSRGRFIVEHEGFLDTTIYAEGREITFAGEIVGVKEGKVGQMDYRFPVMKDIKLYLWEKRQLPVYPSPVFMDDPFFHGPYYYLYYYRSWPSHGYPAQHDPPQTQPPRKEPPRRDPPPGHDDDNEKNGNKNKRDRRP